MKEFLQRYVAHNFWLKLIALATAVLLWSAVSREPMVEVAFNVPIEFQQVPPNLEITTETIPQAQVRLRGPERRLRQLAAADVHPVINLGNTGTGDHTYDLTAEQVHVPYGVDVVQVVPSQLRIGFDGRMKRQVDVRPRVKGTFASGIGIMSIAADPSTITVIGPEKRVRAVTAAMTDPIDASGVVGSHTFLTNAYVADPLVREARPEMIRVTVVTGKVPPVEAEPPSAQNQKR